MAKVRAFYTIPYSQREDILDALEKNFGLKRTINEDYISMRGRQETGIEAVRLSLEEGVIKVLVALEDDSLLEKFNLILGEPRKIKSRRQGLE